MIDWRRKLTSRKFWTAVADFVGMLLVALNVAESTATQVTALIMAGAGVVAYIIGEGMADAGNSTVTHEYEYVLSEEDEPPETVETNGK